MSNISEKNLSSKICSLAAIKEKERKFIIEAEETSEFIEKTKRKDSGRNFDGRFSMPESIQGIKKKGPHLPPLEKGESSRKLA
jgi:hypothetical protein